MPISFSQFLLESSQLTPSDLSEFAQMPKFADMLRNMNAALAAGQITTADHDLIKRSFNRYAETYLSSIERGQLPLALQRNQLPHEVWIELWRKLNDAVGGDVHAELHTIGGRLKKANAWAKVNAQTADPLVRASVDKYILFATQFARVADVMQTLKGKIVKRVIKTETEKAQEREQIHRTTLANSNAIQIVHDALKAMTDGLLPKMVADRLADMRKDCTAVIQLAKSPDEFYTLMRSPRPDQKMINYRKYVYDIAGLMGADFKEDRARRQLKLETGNYQPRLEARAKADVDEVQQQFLRKNVAKLATILHAKGNLKGKPTLVDLTYRRGIFEGDMLLQFTDGSSFRVRNKIVAQFRWTATTGAKSFYQFPTTFHDAVLPSGKRMPGQPSEQDMNTTFVHAR